MERPGLILAVLIVLSIGGAAFLSRDRRVERTQIEQMDERDKKAAEENMKKASALAQADPKRLNMYSQHAEGAIKGEIEIEGLGKIGVEFYPKAAPQTVAHVTELAKKGFYDGILFHRVVANFVAQAGDPNSKKYKTSDLKGMTSEQVSEKFNLGTEGSGVMVPLEAMLPHLPYTIGLARGNDTDSGDSQFFFNLKDNNNLDPNYCAFGKVTSGQEVVDKIAVGDKIKSFTILK